MSWTNGYYYRKRRVGGKVVSEYVGAGFLGQYAAQLDEIERQERQAKREAFNRMVAEQKALAAEIDKLLNKGRNLVALVMMATGHHKHKRQWRRTGKMEETTAITTQESAYVVPTDEELDALVKAMNGKKPTAVQRAEYERHLAAMPRLATSMGDTQRVMIDRLIESLYGSKGSAGAVAAYEHLRQLRKSMCYADAPLHEQMLIQHICVCWVWQRSVEWRHLNHTSGEHRRSNGEYWDRALSAAQARYLRAVEALARVRRLNVNLQVNIGQHQMISNGNIQQLADPVKI